MSKMPSAHSSACANIYLPTRSGEGLAIFGMGCGVVFVLTISNPPAGGIGTRPGPNHVQPRLPVALSRQRELPQTHAPWRRGLTRTIAFKYLHTTIKPRIGRKDCQIFSQSANSCGYDLS